MHVPTKDEVRSRAPAELAEILDVWMYESPTELIPTSSQIEAVRDDLSARADAGDAAVQQLIELCDRYVQRE